MLAGHGAAERLPAHTGRKLHIPYMMSALPFGLSANGSLRLLSASTYGSSPHHSLHACQFLGDSRSRPRCCECRSCAALALLCFCCLALWEEPRQCYESKSCAHKNACDAAPTFGAGPRPHGAWIGTQAGPLRGFNRRCQNHLSLAQRPLELPTL